MHHVYQFVNCIDHNLDIQIGTYNQTTLFLVSWSAFLSR